MFSLYVSKKNTSLIIRSIIFCVSGLLLGQLFSLNIPPELVGIHSKHVVPLIHTQIELGSLARVNDVSGLGLQRRDAEPLDVIPHSNETAHQLSSRALKYAEKGKQMMCNLKNKEYPAQSTWTDPAALDSKTQGWRTSFTLQLTPEILTSLGPWLTENSMSITASDYQTVKSFNDNDAVMGNLPGTDAFFRHVYNFKDGVVIVEDVLGPRQAPKFRADYHNKLAAAFVGVDIGAAPSTTLSDYQVGSPEKLSDMMFLQMLRISSDTQLKKINTIIRYHIVNPETQGEIREALATVSKNIDDVNINRGGAWVTFDCISGDTIDIDACGDLLKTPNGNGGYWLFADHSVQMGSKMLSKITVFSTDVAVDKPQPVGSEDAARYYYMVEQFVAVPEKK